MLPTVGRYGLEPGVRGTRSSSPACLPGGSSEPAPRTSGVSKDSPTFTPGANSQSCHHGECNCSGSQLPQHNTKVTVTPTSKRT